jgi:hypothetical protein
MPVQLKFLSLGKFQWLLYVVENVSMNYIVSYVLKNISLFIALLKECNQICFYLEIDLLNSRFIIDSSF